KLDLCGRSNDCNRVLAFYSEPPMPRSRLAFVLTFAALPALVGAGPEPVPPQKMPPLKTPVAVADTIRGMPLQFRADFEEGKATQFRPTASSAWKVSDQGGYRVYALTVRQSNYKPPQRSPFNSSLVGGIDAGTVAIDVRLQSGMTDYGHRSLCLFFNYVDESHFYYVHFGKEADPHANQI